MPAIDLTTTEAVKGRAEVTSNNDDAEIAAAITGFSRWQLNRSGMTTLNTIATLDEFYDGNGNNRLFVRTAPIVNVTAVIVGGVALPVSSGTNSWGVAIDTSKKSIILRACGTGGTGFYNSLSRPCFPRGLQNIEVQYSGGNNGTPEDLEFATRCVVALNYKRKSWQDMKSKSMSTGAGSSTTTYRDWNWPPEYEAVFDLYTRNSFIY